MNENVMNSTKVYTGSFQTPRYEAVYTVPAKSSFFVGQSFRTFKVIDNPAPDMIKFNFAQHGNPTTIESGNGFMLPEALPNFVIINNDTVEHSVKVAYGYSYFVDNTMSISGTVNVRSTSAEPVYTSDTVFKAVSMQRISDMEANTPNVITPPADVKKTVIQNKGSTNLFVFSDGFIIQPMGVFEFSFSQPFAILSDEAGGKCIVAHFS